MFAALWAKVWKWVAAIGALAAGILAIFLEGREKGKESQQTKVDQATQEAQVATQVTQAVETRHDIDTKVTDLPQAPASTVANAPSGSAAAKLRDDGWMRPEGGN